jgi:DNA-directed RNA polymerase subunit H (RpoH/RPB5)
MTSQIQSNVNNSDFSKIFKSRETLVEILYAGDYDVSGYKSVSERHLHSMINNKQLDMELEKTDKSSKIYIQSYYILGKTIKKDAIPSIVDDLFHIERRLTKNDTLMLIVNEEPNSTILSLLKHIWSKEGIYIVIIPINRLQFNILNHSLVPPHRVVSDDEKSLILIKYNIRNNTQLPQISRFDPVAQAIGLRPGQIVEITRPSKTAITTKYYRICMNE